MTPPPEKSYIDELKKSLYSRSAPDVQTKRKLRFDEPRTELQSDWEHKSEEVQPVELNKRYEDHKMSFFTKLLLVSAVFCIIAVGAGAYLFFNGANLISGDNIDIAIRGPVSIPGGEPVSFDITAINKNNIDLELVDMSVDFPSGSTNVSDPSQTLTNFRKLIGNIPAGGQTKETVQAIIFGEENLQKQIKVTLTYNIKGSTMSFTKSKTYDVLINSSPINVSIDSFKEITSGQEFDIKVAVKSNSDQILKNILLKAQYPFGFTLLSSSITPSGDNSTWRLGDIPPSATRTVTIHGKLTGENSDLRAFHFMVGAQSSKDRNVIGTQYMAIEQDITIEKPFVSLNISIDNDSSTADYVGRFGQSERVEVDWFNNLPVAVSNMAISVKLSGSAYDKSSVRVDEGDFNSLSNTITWNGRTNSELSSVAPGDSGKVFFSITPRDLGTSANPVVNPTITYEASVSGDRPQEENVPSKVSGATVRNTRVASNVSLTGRIVRSVGPFVNTGPIPPKAEQASTYTVIWSVDNTSSTVGNAIVTATLPSYVKWLNAVNPSTEDVTFDQNSGTVTWNIGNVGTYTLSSSRRREVAFQISFTPSVTQAGQYVTLVNQSSLKALDNFTGSQLTSNQDLLTTRFSTDPAYKDGFETVVK